jgi:hypothetical protein
MANFYVGEVLFETGGTIDTPGDINVTAILDCAGTTGTAGQILSSTGTALLWTTASAAGIPCSILTAKGNIVVATGASTPGALPVGTNGQILYACSAATTGLCWATPPAGAAPATPSVSGTVFGCANATNAVIGSGAFSALTTGTCNSGVGVAAFPALTSGCYNIALGDSGGSTITSGCYNIAIGSGQSVANPAGNCQLAIGPQLGFSWLTGNSTLAIKPGAGIIDCAGSCGTAGQVLMSNGSNAICWGAAGGSGTVTSITAGTGLTGGTITTTGTIALNTACVIQPTALTAKGSLITATAASTPTALGVGTNGQVLTACSTCSTGLVWAAPPTVYQTTSTAPYTFSAGVPVNLLNFGDSNSVIDMTLFTTPQGTVSVVWKAVKAGDPTNYNTGWNPYFSWPVPSIYNPGSFTMLYPVYPDPLAGNMILEYTPAASFTSAFTLVYAAMLGAAPTWMI